VLSTWWLTPVRHRMFLNFEFGSQVSINLRQTLPPSFRNHEKMISLFYRMWSHGRMLVWAALAITTAIGERSGALIYKVPAPLHATCHRWVANKTLENNLWYRFFFKASNRMFRWERNAHKVPYTILPFLFNGLQHGCLKNLRFRHLAPRCTKLMVSDLTYPHLTDPN